MPALDRCHSQIEHALQNDGWQISTNSKFIFTPTRTAFIDIEAYKTLNDSHQQILLAEVKCFGDVNSRTREFYAAIGQYLVYRAMLQELQENTPLFLAIPAHIYDTVFDKIARRIISENHIKLLVVDLGTETITQWLEP